MNIEPIERTITEADIIDFLKTKARDIRAKFGPTHYACAVVDVTFYSTHNDKATVVCRIMSGALNSSYEAATFDEAVKAAGAESPESVAATKRATAAKLLAEADALTATLPPSA